MPTCRTILTQALCHTGVGNLLKGPNIVPYRNRLEVAPSKNRFSLALLKLDVKDSFGYNKEIESPGKTFPII